jgi:hypothetical protein
LKSPPSPNLIDFRLSLSRDFAGSLFQVGHPKDAEVASGLGLGMAGVEVGAKVGVGDFGTRHRGPFPEAKLTSD